MVDSLRYETALDAKLMPNLAELRTRSTHARVTTVVDAITVPALRAAFTGVERLSVLSFVSNLFHGESSTHSIFSDLRAAGRAAIVYTDGSFNQFGQKTISRRSTGELGPHELADQSAALRAGLRDFTEHDRPFTVVHLTVTDHVAHWCGVGCEDYNHVFNTVDGLIAELDAQLPSDCTLVVMGDHGHDLTGRHVMGQDVPTVAVYRSPLLKKGLDLGTVHMTAHRYLMGWVAGVGMGEYEGKRYPAALVGTATAPPPPVWSAGAPPRPPPSIFDRALVAAHVGMVFALLLLPFGGRAQVMAALLCIVPLALPQFHPYTLLFGLVAVSVIGWRYALPLRSILMWVAASVALFAWGLALGALRPLVHEVHSVTLALLWCGWFVAIAAATRIWGARVGTAIAFVPLFLSFPSIWKYGAMQAVAGAWLGTTLAHGVERQRQGEVARRELVDYALLAFILLPNFFYHVLNFEPLETIPMRYLPAAFMTWLDAVALLVIVLRRDAGIATCAAAAALACLPAIASHVGASHTAMVNIGALLLCAHLLVMWTTHRTEPKKVWSASLVLALLLGYLAMKGGVHNKYTLVLAVAASLLVYFGLSRGYLARSFSAPLSLMAGMLLFRACIFTPPQAQHWIDYTLAAMVISSRLARAISNEQHRAFLVAALYMVGLTSFGWMVFGWTITWLEWRVVYDWVGEPVVERYIAVFFPLILARYAIPLWLLHRTLDIGPVEWPLVSRLVAVRLWVFMCVTCALVSYEFSAYLDNLSQLILFSVCGLASLAIPRPARWVEAESAPPRALLDGLAAEHAS